MPRRAKEEACIKPQERRQIWSIKRTFNVLRVEKNKELQDEAREKATVPSLTLKEGGTRNVGHDTQISILETALQFGGHG